MHQRVKIHGQAFCKERKQMVHFNCECNFDSEGEANKFEEGFTKKLPKSYLLINFSSELIINRGYSICRGILPLSNHVVITEQLNGDGTIIG